jgi:hypothetical protein
VSILPRGARLTPESLSARHRINFALLWAQVPLLALVGVLGPQPTWEAIALPLVAAAIEEQSAVVRQINDSVTSTSSQVTTMANGVSELERICTT